MPGDDSNSVPAGVANKVGLILYMVLGSFLLLHAIIRVWPDDPAQEPRRDRDGGIVSNGVTQAVQASPTPSSEALLPSEAERTNVVARRVAPAGPRLVCPCGIPRSPAQRMLMIVALSGALGAMVHGIRSFYWYLGNRYLKLSWVPMYYLLPLNGAVLAVAFYLVLRGGLTTGATSTEQLSYYGFAAISSLVGMFSNQALEKLKTIAEQIFAKPAAGSDSKPGTT